MDFFRNKYRAGFIDLKTYEKMAEVIYYLQTKGYRFVSVIGEGAYGTVMKIKNIMSGEEKAVKVVAKSRATEGETELWAYLQHENILSLISCEKVYYADSLIFLTDVLPATLKQQIKKFPQGGDLKDFNQVKIWIKDILAALSYLHDRNLSHMDLKCDNVLISTDKKAVVTDFGYLISCEKKVRRYGAPLLYRCPEAKKDKTGCSEVDGKKFDVWTLGTLCFEIFTGLSLLEQVSKVKRPLFCWKTQIYPILLESLQRERFSELMAKTFSNLPEIDEKLNSVINFITSCLTVNPEKRPSVHWLQQHQLLDGPFEKILLKPDEDIWSKTAPAEVSDYNDQEKSLEVADTQCDDECIGKIDAVQSENNNRVNEEAIKLMKRILESVASDCKKQLPALLTENINADPIVQEMDSKQVECNTPPRYSFISTSDQSVTSKDNGPSVSFNGHIIPDLIVKKKDSYQGECITSPPDIPDHQTGGKAKRQWWKRIKSSVVRIFASCVPCVQPCEEQLSASD